MKNKRALTLFDVTCLGINCVVGSSIFLFPGQLAGILGPASILSFGLVGILLLSVGLCFAEAASHFEGAGGSYLYVRTAFGEWAGFATGWMCWVTQVLGWAAVANGIAVYLGFFGHQFESVWLTKAIAASVILFMGVVNYRGVKLGARTSNFFTVAKLLPLFLLITVGVFFVKAEAFRNFSPMGWAPMGSACYLAYFAFQGFECIPVPSGEAYRPQRNIPLAVVMSISFASILYMAVQFVSVGVLPSLASSSTPLADVASTVLGPAGGVLIVAAAVCSIVGYNAATALASPRYLVALAEDAQLPAWVHQPHSRFNTPYLAVSLTTLSALGLAIVLDFKRLVDFSNVVVTIQYIATCCCVLRLRKVMQTKNAFRLPGKFLIPALGVLATLWLGLQGGIIEIIGAMLALAAGLLLKLLLTIRGTRRKQQLCEV